MKTSVEAVSGVEKRVRVEYPPEEVSKRIEEGYSEVRKMVPIRGFRKGKAPMSMVRRLFREHVESDVAEHLVKESIADAVKENKLRVVAPPRIDGGTIAEGQGFVFTATFEVVPEVVPSGYKGLPVVTEKAEVTNERLDAALRELRESFAQYHAVEGRGAAESDLVEITFSSVSGDERIENDESASVVLGGGLPFGKEFEAALTGVTPGAERTIEVDYPADVPNRKYAGKKVVFTVKVNGVREKRLPELDEDFSKNFKDVSGLADLRDKLSGRLREEDRERSRRVAEEQIRSGLLEKNAVEVPRSLVDRQVLRMIEDTANRLASQGVDLKKVNMDFDKMRERFAPNAEKAVRVSLLLDAIAKQENVEVSYPEIEAEMKEMAAAAGMEFEKVRELYGDEERLDALRDRLLERKVMAFLLANAQVKEEVVTE